MKPADRQAMIRSMVARLAERLKSEPGDARGWVQLGRSYKVLGDMKQARAAYARALALTPGDSDVLIDYIETITQTAKPNAAMPAVLADAAARLVKLRPGHPAGHWFSGVAKLQANDKPGAIAHWKTLRKLLRPDGDQHRDLTKRIEALEKEIVK
jgi:cytochrome c-type biogenesis protein CcmH